MEWERVATDARYRDPGRRLTMGFRIPRRAGRLPAILALAGLATLLAAGCTGGSSSTGSTAVTPAAVAPTTAPASPTPVAAKPLRFTLTSGESEASYLVNQIVAGRDVPLPANGKTKDVAGQISVAPDGTPVGPTSLITVDLRTLKTDQDRRDVDVSNRILETAKYPYAEFTITKVEGIPARFADGDSGKLTLAGPLKLHGAERVTTWTSDLTLKGGRLTGKAQTDLKSADYDILLPNLFNLIKIEPNIHLEIALNAKQEA
jgi:polyisoprenoid-binding protein YceI